MSYLDVISKVWRKSGETESNVVEVLCEVFAVYDDLGHQIMSVVFYHIKH